MIKFLFICNKSKKKKETCFHGIEGMCELSECNYTYNPKFAKNKKTVKLAKKLMETFDEPEDRYYDIIVLKEKEVKHEGLFNLGRRRNGK